MEDLKDKFITRMKTNKVQPDTQTELENSLK